MGIQHFDSVVRAARSAAVLGACLVLANCASSGKFASRVDPKYGVSSSPRVVAYGEPVPKGGGTYRVGKPYTVGGRVYVPEEDVNYREDGTASWYGDDFHGRLTANGEVFDMDALTAAHPTLPMPCYARVTNLSNGKSLIVRVNDRGPYHGNRLIDVSNKAAELLEFKGNGTAHVRVEYVGRAPLEGSDDRQLIATLRTGIPAPAP
jgi:peptidoglycan lytic transglycosylase